MRFFEFTKVWANCKLKDVSTLIGGGTPSTKEKAYWKGTIPWISSSDIQENNVFNINKTRFISENAISHSATKICPVNTILIVSRVGVGKIAISDSELCTSQDFTNLVNYKINKYFLLYLMQQILKKKLNTSQGTSIKGITVKEISEFKIYFPQIKEQEKIGQLFKLLDKRIEAQSKIIKDLELYKKSIYNIIFKQFNKSQTIKLADVLINYNIRTKKDKEYPILSSTMSGIHFQNEYFSKQTASESTLGYKIIPTNYATYRSMSDTGEFHFNIQDVVDFGIVSPAYPVFNCNSTFNLRFVLFLLNNYIGVINQLKALKQGGTRLALPFSTLCKLEIPNIDLKTQEKIINGISIIKSKIQIETEIEEQLKKQKKYLLSNMFI